MVRRSTHTHPMPHPIPVRHLWLAIANRRSTRPCAMLYRSALNGLLRGTLACNDVLQDDEVCLRTYHP